MANNNNIYNAVIAGAGGGNQQRWITDTNSADYTAFLATVQVVAEAVDGAIDPIVGDANIAQTALMQEIVAAVFASRYVQSQVEADYAPVAEAIVALYTRLAMGLLAPTEPGGEIAPLTRDYWTDTGTDVPEEEQTGAINAPFSTLQAAYDAAYIAQQTIGEMPCILLQPMSYAGVTDPNGVHVTFEGIGETLAHRGGTIIGDMVGTNATGWTFRHMGVVGNVNGTTEVSVIDAVVTGTIECDYANFNNGSCQSTVTCATCNAYNKSDVNNIALTASGITVNGNDSRIGTITADPGLTNANVNIDYCTVGTISGPATLTTTARYCDLTDILVPGGAVILENCLFFPNSTVECGDLTIDSLSYQRALRSNVTFTVSGTLTISNTQLKATVSINVPAIGTATDVQYVNTTLTGVLEDVFAVDDSVIVNPQADIAGAGACIASARISAANTLRVGFRGVTTGGAMNFTVSRPS